MNVALPNVAIVIVRQMVKLSLEVEVRGILMLSLSTSRSAVIGIGNVQHPRATTRIDCGKMTPRDGINSWSGQPAPHVLAPV